MSKKTPKLASVPSVPTVETSPDNTDTPKVFVGASQQIFEQADAWMAVCVALDEEVPDWMDGADDADVCAVRAIRQLSAWKAGQMEVLSQLKLEECAKYLPVKLGDSIPEAILRTLKSYAEDREVLNRTAASASSLFSVDLASGTATPVYPAAAHEAFKAAKRPQTSGIQISMVVNGDILRFDGSWLREIGL